MVVGGHRPTRWAPEPDRRPIRPVGTVRFYPAVWCAALPQGLQPRPADTCLESAIMTLEMFEKAAQEANRGGLGGVAGLVGVSLLWVGVVIG